MSTPNNQRITPDPIEEIGLSDSDWRTRFGVPFGRIEEAVEQMTRSVISLHDRQAPVRPAAA